MVKPLAWTAACRLFRFTLQEYLRSPFPKTAEIKVKQEDRRHAFWNRWIRQGDLDLLAAVVCSACLVVISSAYLYTSITKQGIIWSGDPFLTPRASTGEYIAEVVGSALLLLESMLGWWLVRRRRFLSVHDSENALRRDIKRYLNLTGADEWNMNAVPAFDNLTSLTGVYPVYRTYEKKAKWSRIPSLLLVKGDWVALQVGDICPANCRPLSVEGTALPDTASIAEGERITIEMLGVKVGDQSSLPLGRTNIPRDSETLLKLCNDLRLYVVQKSPIEDFLRRPKAASDYSRLYREVQALREFMSVIALLVFVTTLAIVLGRQATSSIQLPFLAALAVLPVAGPTYGFFVEIIGTARILAAVHPHTLRDKNVDDGNILPRYILATIAARLSMANKFSLRIPPASVPLLESLGVATALTLIDDELACEPHSVPQQLLVPSAKGLKLLDLCAVGSENDDTIHSDDSSSGARRYRGKSFDSDSDSDDTANNFQQTLRRLPRRFRRKRQSVDTSNSAHVDDLDEMQFEDPGWWQYLPSLKGIGLACLLVDDAKQSDFCHNESEGVSYEAAKLLLTQQICHEKFSQQLTSLAQCIGFSTEPNESGDRGDITSFEQWLRIHVVSGELFRHRLALDAHERSSEQSRWWGLLRPDSTSVVVKDKRTTSFQLLTVGDPIAVSNVCNEAWQGEISTILPLSPIDRKAILDTSINWKLGDLDVAAFSYAPFPHTGEHILSTNFQKTLYLLDNSEPRAPAISKDKHLSEEWTIIKNQVFLGVLGSLIVPRSEIQNLLSLLDDAGVRFVYFSPRNMRRQKELAIQMGIDVAWNCAISLRALGQGEDEDPHRMVSQYADWDVNAKLPHGVDAVRVHLEEVDNVPLLVSLFTDSTKQNIQDMVSIFQEYHDTVISIGMSHLPRNASVFEESDISIGIDFLQPGEEGGEVGSGKQAAPFDLAVELVSSISSHSCAFRLSEPPNSKQFWSIILKSRSALQGATTAGIFSAIGSISLALYILLSACMPLLPAVPVLGVSFYLQLILPCIGLSLCFTDIDKGVMKQVPPKNDVAIASSRKESVTFFCLTAGNALLPALLPQLLHLIALGSVRSGFGEGSCSDSKGWAAGVTCNGEPSMAEDGLWHSSGIAVFIAFLANVAIVSGGCMNRFASFLNYTAWTWNGLWLLTIFLTMTGMLSVLLSPEILNVRLVLPWYTYPVAVVSAVLCLGAVEALKTVAIRQETRAEKLRRLQFETRLGAWSPR